MIELQSSWIGSEELDNSIGSSGSHYVVPAEGDAVCSLVILFLVGLHRKRATLNWLTTAYLRRSHNLTSPSCPQLNSSWGLLVKQTLITD
jgi:hypothetical protein